MSTGNKTETARIILEDSIIFLYCNYPLTASLDIQLSSAGDIVNTDSSTGRAKTDLESTYMYALSLECIIIQALADLNDYYSFHLM